ncbi:MAG: twin-arginine translocase subunit TatC [Magnetococcus sp. DMHC-6]
MSLNNDEKAPLLDHLIELRNRLMISVLAILIGFLICYGFSEEIYLFLLRPLREVMGPNAKMIYTGLAEAFFTYMKVAFFAALFLALPVVLSQIWQFVAPGLYQHEKRAFLPFLILAPLLFFVGGGIAYAFVFPMAFKFFLSFANESIEAQLKLNEYLSLVITMIFAFGLAFELPVVLILLIKARILSVATLLSKRRYNIVLTFIVAAILTPPDPISQIMMAIPLLLLYEISIFIGRKVEHNRDLRENDPDSLSITEEL